VEALPVWPVSRAEAVMGSSSHRAKGGLTFLTQEHAATHFKSHRLRPYNLAELQHLTQISIQVVHWETKATVWMCWDFTNTLFTVHLYGLSGLS